MTLEIAENVAKHIRVGNTLRCAAQSEGVNWETFKLWLRRGEEGDEPYLTFLTLTRKAEASAERFAIRRLHAGMKGIGPDAASRAKVAGWWLERRRREEWWLRPEQPRDLSQLNDAALQDQSVSMLREGAKRSPELKAKLVALLKEMADDE